MQFPVHSLADSVPHPSPRALPVTMRKPASPSDHQDKEIRKVLARAVDAGWSLSRAQKYFSLRCPCGECTPISVSCTPSNPGRRIKDYKTGIRRCPSTPDFS